MESLRRQLRQRAHLVLAEHLHQAAVDGIEQARAPVHEAGVHLQQVCACAQFFQRRCGAINATDADDGEPYVAMLANVANYGVRCWLERNAA